MRIFIVYIYEFIDKYFEITEVSQFRGIWRSELRSKIGERLIRQGVAVRSREVGSVSKFYTNIRVR